MTESDKKQENLLPPEKLLPTTKVMPKIIGKKTFIDKETGKEFESNVFDYEVRDANFHKIWLGHIILALNLMGNQKIKILSFILQNISHDNVFIGSQRLIAEKTKSALQTVTFTMKILLDEKIIKMRQRGVYVVNPDVIFKGENEKRMSVLYNYRDIKAEEKTEPQEPEQTVIAEAAAGQPEGFIGERIKTAASKTAKKADFTNGIN